MTDSKSASVGDAGGEQDSESKQKAISMLQQDWIGFDLDHTLVRYKMEPLSELIFSMLTRFLVEHKGYSKQLLSWRMDPEYNAKGIVFDLKLGNFLKLNRARQCVLAFHGHRRLSASEIKEHYPAKMFAGFTGEPSERFHAFITYFDLPTGSLMAQLVELQDADKLFEGKAKAEAKTAAASSAASAASASGAASSGSGIATTTATPSGTLASFSGSGDSGSMAGNFALGSAPSAAAGSGAASSAAATPLPAPLKYAQIVKDIIAGFGYNFGSGNDAGYYFPELVKHTGRYVFKRPDVREWLRRLRAHGVRLFLVTNSQMDYADVLLRFSFGDDWSSLFDINVVNGRKPAFFTAKNPFYVMDAKTQQRGSEPVKRLKLGGLYAEGNSAQLHEYFQEQHAANWARKAALQRDLLLLAAAGSRSSPSASSGAASAAPAGSAAAAVEQQTKRPEEPAVIYFGDHLRTDVQATALHTPWVAGAVVEELIHHSHHSHEHVHHVWDDGVSPATSLTSPASSSATGDASSGSAASAGDAKVAAEAEAKGRAAASAVLSVLAAAARGNRSKAMGQDYTALSVSKHWGSFFRGTHGHDEETSAGSKVEAKSPSATAGSSDGGGSSGSEREASAAGEGKGLPTALEDEDASFWSVVIAQYSALAVPCLSVLAHQELDRPTRFALGSMTLYDDYEGSQS